MKNSQQGSSQKSFFDQIQDYLRTTSGLKSFTADGQYIRIHQQVDGKIMSFDCVDVEEVISRVDGEGQSFLQVNFLSGKKILLTETLVGFKPAEASGLDLTKLPKVVTTPDLISVVEAIEEALSSPKGGKEELEVLKQVFSSVLKGAETVGFDLKTEKVWLQHLVSNPKRASA